MTQKLSEPDNLHIETGWIQTASGKKFPVFLATPEDIDIYDIAHSLALQCRFAGHCRQPYSVAQHSVLVSYNVPPEDALWGLLHDAAEAYVTDVPRPVKRYMRACANLAYDVAEATVKQAIAQKFSLSGEQPKSVNDADLLLLATEARDLMSPLHPDWHYCEENGYPVLPTVIEPWHWLIARQKFLERFLELTKAK